MKLHLGCGRRKWDGYINCDLQDSDVDCDIRVLPFDDNSADEIVAIHVVEHFMITEVRWVLADWLRVLRPGGELIIELPCWDKVVSHIKANAPDNMTRWALFGDPSTHKDGFPAVHKWCYSIEEMTKLLGIVGFRDIQCEEPKFHQPSRDMRFKAVK
jgi:predicted SAM-dependent methyltransferase